MKAILIKDVEKLGKAGDLVDVKNGYFNNYLQARGLAIRANSENVKQWEKVRKEREAQEKAERAKAMELKEQIEKTIVTVPRKAGEKGQLFGSVTSQDIADAMAQQGMEVDKKKVEIKEPIRKLGDHMVTIRVYPDTTADLKVRIAEDK